MAKRKAKKKIKKTPKKQSRGFKPYTIDMGVSQGRLNNFLSCRQRAKFHAEGWHAIQTSSAIAFGLFYHWILEELYQAVRDEKVHWDDDELLAFYNAKADEWCKQQEKRLGSAPERMERVLADVAMGQALFFPYCDYYEEDFDPSKWVSLESSFDVQWKSYRLKGRMDGICKKKKEHWLLETKTKSRIDEKTLDDSLTFDFQNLFYLLCAEIASGVHLSGVDYNIVRKPQLRQGKKETLEDFQVRMQEDVAARPEHYFKRYPLTYPKEVRVQFEQELGFKLYDFRAWLDGRIATYKNETACTGTWNCEFLQACASGKMTGYQKGFKV